MGVFVRVVAVFVGLANVYVAGSSGSAAAFMENESPAPSLALRAVVAGLVASEVILRFMRPALWSGFFARYAATALALCLGGLIFGASTRSEPCLMARFRLKGSL